MSDIKLFEAIGTNLRTGLDMEGRAFVVRNDLADAMGVQRAMDLTRGMGGDLSEYHGEETIQTKGGSQKVAVLYKRGVFHVLMVSRKPEAMAFKNQLFDFLEEYERDGFVVKDDITPQQSARLIEKTDYKQVLDSLSGAQDYGAWKTKKLLGGPAFANLQNGLYKVAIGTTADDYREKNDLPETAVVKDHLSPEQLNKLQGVSMVILGQLRLRFPDGVYKVEDFRSVYHDAIKSAWTR